MCKVSTLQPKETTKCPVSNRKIQKYIENSDYHLEAKVPNFVGKQQKLRINQVGQKHTETEKITLSTYAKTMKEHNKIKKNKKKILMNMSSIDADFEELLGHLYQLENKPEIVILTETWRDKSLNMYSIEGYHLYYNIRNVILA